ncbi:hypothetical protein ACOMHN_005152 [Nucella lapillus]
MITTTTTTTRKDYQNPLSRQLGLGFAQSVQKISWTSTVYGTQIWRLRPTCHGVPFSNLDFAVHGQVGVGEAPPCSDPTLLSNMSCPPLRNNSASMKLLDSYKDNYLRDISSTAAAGNAFHKDTIRRTLIRFNGLWVRLVDEVDALWEGPSLVARVFIIMDACSGRLMHISNKLALGRADGSQTERTNRERRDVTSSNGSCQPPCPKGQGGNDALGIVQFGSGPNEVCLDATVRKGQFWLENQYASVHDSRARPTPTTHCNDVPIVCFDCESGPNDGINGGKSPTYDALYGMGVIRDLLNEWYPDFAEDLTEPVPVCTHFGTNYTNCAWTGESILLGNGEPGRARPFTTLDNIAHEFGHYLTECYSRMLLMGQAGGLQDAFSDAFAKAADAFTNGGQVSSWQLGAGIMLQKDIRAIRHMDNPPIDGLSIAHASKYTVDMDSHYSCGVFNKFFYCMVQNETVSVRDTFLLYLTASKVRWNLNDTFLEASCHLLHAAYHLGVSTASVQACLNTVGLPTVRCPLSTAVHTVCKDGIVTVQASRTRQPYFKVCRRSKTMTVTLLTSARVFVSRSNPYLPTKAYAASCGGVVKYSLSRNDYDYVRIVGNWDDLQTVRFAVKFSSGLARGKKPNRRQQPPPRDVTEATGSLAPLTKGR